MPIYKTNRRKDGKQQYRVVVNYTTGDGQHKRKEQSCIGYEAAQQLEKTMQQKYSRQSSLGELSFEDFFEVYQKIKQNDNRETSNNKCREIVERHIVPYIGRYPIMSITLQQLLEWRDAINNSGLGISMKQHCFTHLRAVFRFAYKIDAIHENPTNKIENFRDNNFECHKTQIQFYTPEEFQRFAMVARGEVNTFFRMSIYVFLCIAYYTGMRKGEIHALKWSDIDGNCINVRRSISQKVKGKPMVETAPKNRASLRVVQIPKPLLALLTEHRQRQQALFPEWSTDYRVCAGERLISDTSLANYNNRWAELAGLHRLRIHDYRHSHASLLANNGINIQEIARRLGHSNVSITWERYAHLYPQESERALQILNQIELPI